MHGIAIVTGAHLCRNPRVVKEADALARAGYEVIVVGPILSDELEAVDADLLASRSWRRVASVDLRTRRGDLDRVRRRLGMEVVRRLGRQSPDALGYGIRAALRIVRNLRPDLTIGHQEVGLWVASEMRRRGFRAGADLEDWYSRDLLPQDRVGRPVGLLERLEAEMLAHGKPVFTTSDVMGVAMEDALGGRRPVTIYNAFPWSDRKAVNGSASDRRDRSRPSLHWVSQTIGPGRGLDLLMDALGKVDTPIDVHLRGNVDGDAKRWLNERFPTHGGHRLHMHNLVPPDELLSRLAEHDIGLALEESTPPSRDLTITNKILHYLLAGMAVRATPTAGQREVGLAAQGAVRLLPEMSSHELACAISDLVSTEQTLADARAAALDSAQRVFCWERQEPRLVEAVEQALGAAPPVA